MYDGPCGDQQELIDYLEGSPIDDSPDDDGSHYLTDGYIDGWD
jgi:hypothetical protein